MVKRKDLKGGGEAISVGEVRWEGNMTVMKRSEARYLLVKSVRWRGIGGCLEKEKRRTVDILCLA